MGTNTKEYSRQYYEKNKERIQQMMTHKIVCGNCGSVQSRLHMTRHQNSKKCLDRKMKTV